MADHAFAPAGEAPIQLALPDFAQADLDGGIQSFAPHQVGFGLFPVPGVRIADPFSLLPGQQTGFDPAPLAVVADFRVESERLDQHGPVGEAPAQVGSHACAGLAPPFAFTVARWQIERPFLEGAVRPQGSVHRVGDHAGRQAVARDRGKQPGSAQAPGEAVAAVGGVVGFQGMEPPLSLVSIVEHQQIALSVHLEGDDSQGSICQLLVPDDFPALHPGAPDLAGGIVAVDVGSPQFREPGAVVDQAAGHGASFGMRVFQQGLGYGSGSQLAIGIEDVAALVDAPAVVGSPFHKVDLFPEVLSVVAHP